MLLQKVTQINTVPFLLVLYEKVALGFFDAQKIISEVKIAMISALLSFYSTCMHDT